MNFLTKQIFLKAVSYTYRPNKTGICYLCSRSIIGSWVSHSDDKNHPLHEKNGDNFIILCDSCYNINNLNKNKLFTSQLNTI